MDIDREALAAVDERIHRQKVKNVYKYYADFNHIFLNRLHTAHFFRKKFHARPMELITLQHSLYYCKKELWAKLYRSLFTDILAPKGALYSVLMSAASEDSSTTTWLYDHFAGKFFGHRNDQDLLAFKKELLKDPLYRSCRILSKTSRVGFFVDQFDKFMAVVWMILLYPDVHRYTLEQKKEIVEFSYSRFFSKKKPLIQLQDHLVVYRGLGVKGII
jgi:hypothetical protein